MKQLFTLISLIFISFFWVEAQELYTIQGVVCDSDKEPLSFGSVKDCHTDSLYLVDNSGRFVIKTDTLPIVLEFKSIGYVKKKVTVTKENYKDLSPITIYEEVILDFFDERGHLLLSEEEYEKWGQYKGILVGKVIDQEDKEPMIGASVRIVDKKQKTEWSALCDTEGKFYLPIQHFPSHIEIEYIGYKTIYFKVTKKKVKTFQTFQMEVDHSGLIFD